MQSEHTIDILRFDVGLFSQPFRLLDTDPSATAAEMQAAYERAIERRTASGEDLAEAHAALVNLDWRLACELTYPIGCTPELRDVFYASDPQDGDLLQQADRLPPLPKANFIARKASRNAAKEVLLALIDAHAAIDVLEVYEFLRTLRSCAGFPAPSLASVRDGLNGLFEQHCSAAAHEPEKQSIALMQATQEVLASRDRARIETLSGLVEAYRHSSKQARMDVEAKITAICGNNEQPTNDGTLSNDHLAELLRRWVSLAGPPLLLDSHLGRFDPEREAILRSLRKLLGSLGQRRDYQAAQRIMSQSKEAFRPVPPLLEHINSVAAVFQKLLSRVAIEQIEVNVAKIGAEPDLVSTSLRTEGFGVGSTGALHDFWDSFCHAVEVSGPADIRPWMLVRQCAEQLSRRGLNSAAIAITTGMIRHGEGVSADPAILGLLQDDLERQELHKQPPEHVAGKRVNRKALIGSLALLAVLLGASGYWVVGKYSLPFQRSPLSRDRSEPELLPPIGKGQRLTLEYVRYCHFQAERLRVIKQHVRSAEDIREYNALANDYNSRCSDFYFQDDDLQIVKDEVVARRKLLQGDAERILSTWSWRVPSSQTGTSSK